ncbi:glycosyltransferase family 4 protein [candidate division KSB1 bacterium]|nr:glycosyltransferase family 4 protein [candidate division KSB1 bacterium]
MRILLITPRLPYPPYRGDKLKIFNLLKRLAKRHAIHLISFVEGQRELEYIQFLQPYCAAIETVPLPRWRSYLQCLFGLFSALPLQVHYFKSEKMRRRIDEICSRNHFDVIHTHLIRMAQYTAHYGHQLRALDLTDAVSLYLNRFLSREKNLIKKLILKIELERIKRYENILEQFHACFVCSEPDKEQLLQAAPEANIRIIPNGVDLAYFSSNGTTQYDPEKIVFTGNLTYHPNIDGIFYFVNEIFPLVKKEAPAAKFYIVGQSPPAKVRALASNDVIVTGFVEDIKQYYLNSAVAVSPIRFGAGTLNKILEPLALGVPVVATSMGTEGFDLTNGKEILIADGPHTFARHVVRVMKEPAYRDSLGQEGMAIVRRLYNWDAIVQALENVYQEMIEERSLARHAKYRTSVE